MTVASILSDMTVVEFGLPIEHSQLYENNSQEGERMNVLMGCGLLQFRIEGGFDVWGTS